MNHAFRRVERHRPDSLADLAQPPAPDSLMRLHYAIDSLRRGRDISLLQLVAATAGQGTSMIAGMLARIAAASRETSVLLLECHPSAGDDRRGVRSITEAFNAGLPLKQTATTPAHDGLYRRAMLSAPSRGLLELSSNGLRDMFETLRQGFDLILLDTPAAADTPAAGALSRYCDGTLLVVQAERATADSVQALRRDIELAGGQVLGTVLNRQRQHLPHWLQRRLQ